MIVGNLMFKKRVLDAIASVLVLAGGPVLMAGIAAKSGTAQLAGLVMCGIAYVITVWVRRRIAPKDGGKPTWSWMLDTNNLKVRDVAVICAVAAVELALALCLYTLWSG